jgi:hypothetical protein
MPFIFYYKILSASPHFADGATALAEHGVSPAIIQASGRWASQAFLVYIRKNPTLLQGFLSATTAAD